MRPGKHLAAFFFILLSFSAAYACSCAPTRSPCNYYATDAVFLGRVVGSSERKTYTSNGEKIVVDVGTIRFLVQENYKGAPGYEVEVESGVPCASSFFRNESYVVYAGRMPNSDKLYTGMCTRTRHVSAAEEDLAYWRGLATAKPGATLYGNVTRIIGDARHGPFEEGPKMAGVKIIVTGEGRSFETTTDANGQFKLTGLSPGGYDAYPELPNNLGSTSTRDKEDKFGRFLNRDPVRLADRGCREVNFTVQFNGSVSGRVVDAEGKPAKEIQVSLVSGDDGDKDWWTWTDEEGRYEFPMVQPGSYLLGFNLRWVPDKDDPYPKTFYPGVKTRSEAALLTLGEGEKLKGYDMTLPIKLTTRQVTATVVWPDGSPAVNVDVRYEISEGTSPGESVKTDKQGRAVLTLFENYSYIVLGSTERNNNDVHSAPIEIVVNKHLKPFKLVLNQDGYGEDEKEALKRKSCGPPCAMYF